MPSHTDRPLAAPGFVSYRYKGRYGYVMVGASNTEDALRQARRSIDGPALIGNLDVWDADAGRYVPCA